MPSHLVVCIGGRHLAGVEELQRPRARAGAGAVGGGVSGRRILQLLVLQQVSNHARSDHCIVFLLRGQVEALRHALGRRPDISTGHAGRARADGTTK